MLDCLTAKKKAVGPWTDQGQDTHLQVSIQRHLFQRESSCDAEELQSLLIHCALSPDKRLLWFEIISHAALPPPTLLFILDFALFSVETTSHILSSGDFFKVRWDGWRSSGGSKVQKLVSLTWKQKKCRLITAPCWAQAALFTACLFQTHINHLWEKKKLEMPLPVSSCVGYQSFRVPPIDCDCIHNPRNDIQRFSVWNARLSRPQFHDCGAAWLFPHAGANRNCCIFDKLHQSPKTAFKNQATQWAPAGCIRGGDSEAINGDSGGKHSAKCQRCWLQRYNIISRRETQITQINNLIISNSNHAGRRSGSYCSFMSLVSWCIPISSPEQADALESQ